VLETQSISLSPSESFRSKVEVHLEALLQSEAFSTSPRCREFLHYVVTEVLAGRGPNIKERTVAMDVFGRGADFDSQTESIVRVKALEVRKRLVQAYQNMASPEVRIELPTGSYVPVIHCETTTAERPPLQPVADPAPRRNRFFLAFGAFALVSLCMSLLALGKAGSQSSFDSLWKPFVQGRGPVLISLPAPDIYELKRSAYARLQSGCLIAAPADVQRRENYYVGVGAAEGAARFGEQLGHRNKAFVTKFGDDVSFSDLRQAPAILLGASSSHWTMELTRNLPIRFQEHDFDRIVFAADPTRFWQEDAPTADGPRRGYALITRLLNSESGNALLMVAGINAYDTQSAVEFLTRPEFFDQFALHAGRWSDKNFQVVIRTAIHDHTPGPPVVVAHQIF
jgi:hypothetical protein